MPAGYKQLSTLSSGQQNILNQILSALGGQPQVLQQSPLYQSGASYLQSLLSGSPEATSAFEAPYLRRFHEETVPALAERFSGMGAGSQRSSAFTQALGAAGAGLSENLASLRGQLQFGAVPQALGYAQQPISNVQNLLGINTQAFVPKSKPFWQQLLLGLGPSAGQAAGSLGTSAVLRGIGF